MNTTLAIIGMLALIAGGFGLGVFWRHSQDPAVRAVRRMRQKARITELEKGVGFEVSYPDAELPRLVVVRNPGGDFLLGDCWEVKELSKYGDGIIEGRFDLYRLSAATKRGAVANAQRYLEALVQSRVEGPTEVRL